MCETAGASSIYNASPLERLQRDTMTVVQHVVAQPRIYEMAGELILTGASSSPIL
jgi:hypothetical protein